MREWTEEEEEEAAESEDRDQQQCRPQRHHPLAMDPLAAWATWQAVVVQEEPPPWAMWWAGWSRFCPNPKIQNVISESMLNHPARYTVYTQKHYDIPAPLSFCVVSTRLILLLPLMSFDVFKDYLWAFVD